ncbi:hypothetical protein A2U01_0095469, partial [Trifolium medium]|nr:hypothetical protein [Trifolium medium]
MTFKIASSWPRWVISWHDQRFTSDILHFINRLHRAAMDFIV